MTELDADGKPFEPHLIPSVTERGFLHMPEVMGTYDQAAVQVYESSGASEAFVWLYAHSGRGDCTVHLALQEASHLRDQLTYLIENHYQVKPR